MSSLNRRHFLGALAASVALPVKLSFAAVPGDQRFVLVILRGAMDGLTAVPPYFDRNYKAGRPALAVAESDMTDLDGRFGLHKNLATMAQLWKAQQLLVLHAAATPYRERSHFDAQNLLEGGGVVAHGEKDGWLNRTLGLLGGRAQPLGLAVGSTTPLVLTGTAPITTYAPTAMPDASTELLQLAQKLMASDPALTRAFTEGTDGMMLADAAGGDSMAGGMGRRNNGAALAQVAAKMLAAADGPRLAVLDVGGWDTHTNQSGRLPQALQQLDGVLAALVKGLAPQWKNTTVVVVSEFGRTFAANGTGGTDHGTATAAFLMGGSVNGGRVLAEWPGLASQNLYQNRDLAPTTDLRSLLKGVLAQQYGLSADVLSRVVFPDSGSAAALPELLRV